MACSNMKTNFVDVIAIFNGEGNIRPLYIKIQGFDTVKIEHIVSKGDAPFTGRGNVIAYKCTYIYMNEQKIVTLYYHIKDHVWTVPGLQNDAGRVYP